jgi:hypothetical protein
LIQVLYVESDHFGVLDNWLNPALFSHFVEDDWITHVIPRLFQCEKALEV